MPVNKDIKVLRDLAKQLKEIASKDIQKERRDLWRKHNSLIKTPPPILVRMFMVWEEIYPDRDLKCEEQPFREQERYLRQMIFQDTIGDDYVIEPWLTVKAVHQGPYGDNRWVSDIDFVRSHEPGGGRKFNPPINKLEDIKKLIKPYHQIDREKTALEAERIREAVGDIIEVDVDSGPVFRYFNNDISTDLGGLRGLEQLMWDMYDNPEWLHEFISFMRDGIMAVHEQAEAAGDWTLCSHENQAMPYAMELEDPKPNVRGVKRNCLWAYAASQEFTLISPEMFDEFMLQYQIPILEKFGLVSYGCCEDLTRKITYLKKIKNLRRIAVTPWADTKSCAEQIGKDYVASYRPSPAEMVCVGFEPDRIRQIVGNAIKDFSNNGCHVDITLKDIQTLQGNPERLREWVRIVRELTG